METGGVIIGINLPPVFINGGFTMLLLTIMNSNDLS